jgi:serine protease
MPAQIPRVILKFHDSVMLPYEDGIGSAIDQRTGDSWRALEQRFPGVEIVRLYRAVSQDELTDTIRRAVANDSTYRPPNFFTFYVVRFPETVDAEEVASALRLWPSVELAYPEGVPSAPTGGALNPGSYALNHLQGYEDPAPLGIDARCAWGIPGGDGFGQAVIDLEAGWTLNHDDFVVHHPQLLFGGLDPAQCSHGASVLGIICARENKAGTLGVAPNVDSVNVVSYVSAAGVPAAANIPDAIAAATNHLDAGNVLVLEVELNFMPCEIDAACYATIRLATALGISVVEAAGNGAQNLDTWVDSAGHPTLFRDPNNSWFKDSLAIMVAAATSATPHRRSVVSNFGARIDCYAWGDSVMTSSSVNAGDLSSHTAPPEFSKTSAATAIIAGAALSVQGMAEAATGGRLPPTQLRQALGLGTASADPIGIMPDLCAIAASLEEAVKTHPQAPTNLRIIT